VTTHRPPRERALSAPHAAASAERRRDASLRLLVRHPYGDVDRATAVAARLFHLLEPESRPPTARIHEVLGGTVAARLIPERSAPERQHLGGRARPRDDEQALNGRRIGRQAPPTGGPRGCGGALSVEAG